MSRQCTFASTGPNFKFQEWYECRTCGLVDGSGVCAVCAQQCHRGCNLSAPRNSKFYCDCGQGGCASMTAGGKKKSKKTAKVKRSMQQQQQLNRPPQISMQQQQQLNRPPQISMQQQQQYVPPQQQQARRRSGSTVNIRRVNAASTAPPRPLEYRPEELGVNTSASVIRLPPLYFMHVLDTNTNVTRIVTGPATVTRMDMERVTLGPVKMLLVPPAHYAVIADPVVRDDAGEPVMERGQYVTAFGAHRVCVWDGEPFALYPDERVVVAPSPLPVIPEQCALRLRAERAFTDNDGVERQAGEEWHVEGPCSFLPMPETIMVEIVSSISLNDFEALRLRARNDFEGSDGVSHRVGEEWLVTGVLSYLPDVNEEALAIIEPIVLTETTAVHVRALQACTDALGVERKAGTEWLVTHQDAAMYIPGVFEELVSVVEATVLANDQYAIILDPVDEDGTVRLGRAEVRRGPLVFFLNPYERLKDGEIKTVTVLEQGQALLVRALEATTDEKGNARVAGDRWLVMGPAEYCPSESVDVVELRNAIPLAEHEGVYVRDTLSGLVRLVVGETYLLQANEELFAKTLNPQTEELLTRYGSPANRDPTRAVSIRVPHNAAAQIYDYRRKTARVVMGPYLVMLAADEELTKLSLSGGKPKRPNEIKDLVLFLGPEYSTDIMTVETSDHARLNLRLSFSWFFDVDPEDEESKRALFSVPDPIGDMCKAIASRVRGAVASVSFDTFHQNSSSIINFAVFGKKEDGTPKDELRFRANNLVVVGVDIQAVEPVDKSTRSLLMQTVQKAISNTTDSLEAEARHRASQKEQVAMGQLNQQRIEDDARIEQLRAHLLDLKAQSAAIKTTGQATSEAQARADAVEIEGKSAVQLAELRAKAAELESKAELERMTAFQDAEVAHMRAMDNLEVERTRLLAEINARKFKQTVEAVEPSTIAAVAAAGPETQAELLQGLGLEGFLVTSGDNPINLFDTALGMVQ